MQSVVTAAGLRVGIAVCESAGLKMATVAALQRLGEGQAVEHFSFFFLGGGAWASERCVIVMSVVYHQ